MTFGTSMMIFFLAIIALVAEFILYMLLGIGIAFSGDLNALSGTAFFFVSLMVLTAATGILAPISALVELIIKKKHSGVYFMVSVLGLILVGLIIFNALGIKTMTDTNLLAESQLTKNRESDKETPFSSYWIKNRKVNVRSGPSTKDSLIATLKQGKKVYSITQQGEWHKISLGKERWAGYIHLCFQNPLLVQHLPSRL